MSASNHPPPGPVSRVQSQARSHSRPHSSRNNSRSSVPYLPHGPDALLYPEGAVSEEAVELLHEFVHPGHAARDAEQTLVGEEAEGGGEMDEDAEEEEEAEMRALEARAWYRRPSPWWILAAMPFSAMAMSACVAPRVEIYTELACRAHRPEYKTGTLLPVSRSLMLISPAEPRNFANVIEDNDDLGGLIPSFSFGDKLIVEGENEEPNPCAKDPEVNAAAAKLIAAMTTVMGILSCLTTGFWGTLSDRVGRLRVMGISAIGLLITDLNFIFVYNFSERLPGGYWFLLLGPVVEGLLGGFTAGVAAIHAYVADTTDPTSRSRTFSLSLGLLFIGMAFGPTFGSILIRSTHQVISVFYFATAVHIAYTLAVWFVVPESLTPRVRAKNRERHAREVDEARRSAGQDSRVLAMTKRVFYFLSPLTVFAPETIRTPGSTKTRRDWNLTLLAAAFGCAALVFSSYQFKFQYAAMTFGWTSEELGYWLSLVGATRAFFLTAVLPILIKLFNKPKPAIQLPTSPSEPLTSSSPPHAPSLQQQQQHMKPAPHTLSFDLGLARGSLALEVLCFGAMIPLASYASAFTLLSMLVSFAGGFNPAVQALALELFTRRLGLVGDRSGSGPGSGGSSSSSSAGAGANGRLFGALSVVQALCSQIIGPTLFGITYMKTVAVFPRTIFVVSALCVTTGLICMSLVRIDKNDPQHNQETGLGAGIRVEREETLVDDANEVIVGNKKSTTAHLIQV